MRAQATQPLAQFMDFTMYWFFSIFNNIVMNL